MNYVNKRTVRVLLYLENSIHRMNNIIFDVNWYQAVGGLFFIYPYGEKIKYANNKPGYMFVGGLILPVYCSVFWFGIMRFGEDALDFRKTIQIL